MTALNPNIALANIALEYARCQCYTIGSHSNWVAQPKKGQLEHVVGEEARKVFDKIQELASRETDPFEGRHKLAVELLEMGKECLADIKIPMKEAQAVVSYFADFEKTLDERPLFMTFAKSLAFSIEAMYIKTNACWQALPCEGLRKATANLKVLRDQMVSPARRFDEFTLDTREKAAIQIHVKEIRDMLQSILVLAPVREPKHAVDQLRIDYVKETIAALEI